MSPEREGRYRLGLLGLGVMGSALARNLIRHEIPTALYSVSQRSGRRILFWRAPALSAGRSGSLQARWSVRERFS